MSKTHHESETANPNGQSQTPEASPKRPTGAIEQAIVVRDLLRGAAGKANDLIRALQQERKQVRQLRTALASLREIQQLEL